MGYETFRKLCDENHVTPNMVAREIGIDSTTFSAWKNGKYTPKQDKRQRVADYFGVSLEYLDTGDESLRDIEKEIENASHTDEDLKALFSIAMKATPEERKQFVKIAKAIMGEE